MSRFLLLPLLTCVILVSAGCKKNPSVTELKSTFYSNKRLLDSLLTSLHTDKKLDSLFYSRVDLGLPDIEKNYPVQFSLIQKIGITEISSHHVCNRCPRWHYIKTNWSVDPPIYLITGLRDTTESEKGFYKIDEYQNET